MQWAFLLFLDHPSDEAPHCPGIRAKRGESDRRVPARRRSRTGFAAPPGSGTRRLLQLSSIVTAELFEVLGKVKELHRSTFPRSSLKNLQLRRSPLLSLPSISDQQFNFCAPVSMDKVVEAVEEVKKEWGEAYCKTQEHIKAIGEYGKSREEKSSLPRLNGLVQDGLALLNSLQFKLDLLAPQLPSEEDVESAKSLLESWKNHYQTLRVNLRNANLQAKANMRKAAQEERELLLGGGGESTARRRNLQYDKSWNDISCGKYHGESSSHASTDGPDESTGVLKKAESEYKGQRSLLMRTRNLLSTMQRQDVIDRIILVVGFILFFSAVLYVVSKRIGILTLQRKVTAALKASMAGQAKILNEVNRDGADFHRGVDRNVELPNGGHMHDEL
ncbi:hypothetical protein CDL15_Pgr011169 [Punica granatum]|uniref:Sec20 C-terminal domain-containing protein n=1 Tax=Punica granatum TaxID=22663 RepID=A0A218WG74_PUNGR|nr:hypothetical protein CDL15_Pgr011169 [Punica granatum]